ncbi:hypothetical protein FK498_05780 [Elioraea sp. Yellowstone]|jgi:hypothetical protein|uniref:hypothetical protein n=1 Tax=Elioraea sp. Yellowstone TaxID=2592070 RepID=UPI0011546EBC|nr:hypothetical protein [Elioraea sp. Yellowstone]TQF80830.1 hypothetical protein FK498_05780 [Elioraea sp. Yellowstone]
MIEARLLLARKLSEATETPWDPDRPTRVELVECGAGVGLRFFAMKRTGEWVMVHEEPSVPLATEADADDLLARGLSIFLMNHPTWPA